MPAQNQGPRTRLVRTQLELADALRDADFGELDLIAIDMPREASVLRLGHASPADISIQGFSKVHVTGHVRAEVRDHAAVFASQFAEIRARGDARVIAIDFATEMEPAAFGGIRPRSTLSGNVLARSLQAPNVGLKSRGGGCWVRTNVG